jgi:hypothetical protein
MHQDCRGCPLYAESLGGMFAYAMAYGVVEISGVGPAWDDMRMRGPHLLRRARGGGLGHTEDRQRVRCQCDNAPGLL